ncbi:hypothetical protein BGZ98_006914, partial [Dissophora globulifera]
MGLVQRTNRLPSDSSQLGKSKKTSSLLGAHHLPTPLGPTDSQFRDLAHIPLSIFNQDMAPAAAKYSLPKAGARLESTPQLAYCLSLLPSKLLLVKSLNEAERVWSQAKADDEDEQDRLRA